MDAELLVEVYCELCGGRQRTLGFATVETARGDGPVATAKRARPAPLPERASQAELDAHDALIDSLGESAIWRRYAPAADGEGD